MGDFEVNFLESALLYRFPGKKYTSNVILPVCYKPCKFCYLNNVSFYSLRFCLPSTFFVYRVVLLFFTLLYFLT